MKKYQVVLSQQCTLAVEVIVTGESVGVTVDGESFTFSHAELRSGKIFGHLEAGNLSVCGPALQGSFECRSVSKKQKTDSTPQGMQNTQLRALFPGKVVRVFAKAGDTIQAGDAVLIMESMKMEFNYQAPMNMRIRKVLVNEGQTLAKGQDFFEFDEV